MWVFEWVVVWLLYGYCMVVVWLLYGLVLGNSTRQRVNHPVACPCAGRAHGGSRREESSGRSTCGFGTGAVCEQGRRMRQRLGGGGVMAAGAADVVAVCVAAAGVAVAGLARAAAGAAGASVAASGEAFAAVSEPPQP